MNYPELQDVKLYPELIPNQNQLVEFNTMHQLTSVSASAPELEITNEQIIEEINWNQLPSHTKKTNSSWNGIFSKMKYSLGGATIFSALFLTASPLVVVGTVLSLGLSTYGCHKIEQKIENTQENVIMDKKQKRLNIKKIVESGINGYDYIRQKYCPNGIVTDEEFNVIFGYDLKKLYYPIFIKKHGYGCFDILNETNCFLLKESFLEHAKRDLCLLKINEYSKELKFFSINDDIYYLVMLNEVSRLLDDHYTFEQFIKRNGFDFGKWVNDVNREIILNSKLENYLVDLDIGYEKIKEKYQDKCSTCIFSEPFKFLIFTKELEKFQNGMMNYNTLKQRNGFSLIEDVAMLYPYNEITVLYSCKELVKVEFSKLPYDQLVSSDNEIDRKLFSIGSKEIKDILLQRWIPMPIQQIIQEDEGFFNCIGREFSVEELRPKIMADTIHMSVIDIAKNYPGLFLSKILTPDTKNEYGITIKERFENELGLVVSLDDVINNVPSVLFKFKIINKNTINIATLVVSYILSHLNECMVDGSKIVHMIEKYDLIPDNIVEIYHNTAKYVQSLKEKHILSINHINYPHQDNLLQKKKNRINLFEQKLENAKKIMEENKNNYESCRCKLETLEKQHGQLHEQRHKNIIEISSIEERSSNLQCSDVVEKYETISEQLEKERSLLESAQYQIKNDLTCCAFDRKIKELENQESEYTKQNESIKKLNDLKPEMEKLTKNIQILQEKVGGETFMKKREQLSKDLDNTVVTGLIGVASAIKGNYFTSKPKELSNMEEEEKLLEKKKAELSSIQSQIKEIESSIVTHQDTNKLLSECKISLEKSRSNKKDHIVTLKNTLQTDKLEKNILKLKQLKDSKEKINENKQKILNLQNENIKLETQIWQIGSVASIEQHNTINYSNNYKSSQQDLIIAEQELNHNKWVAQKEFDELFHQMEYDRQKQIIISNEKLQKEIGEILNDTKIKIGEILDNSKIKIGTI
jgi:hypothetical protein